MLIAGVPGGNALLKLTNDDLLAGGFDAIFCIVVNENCASKVREFWASSEEFTVCPLMCEVKNTGMTCCVQKVD